MEDSRDERHGGAIRLPATPDRAAAIRRRIDSGARARAVEPPPLALRRTATLAPELSALGEAIEALRARMDAFGAVTTDRSGWVGRLELGVKRALRKLVARHLDQEREVHAALQAVLTQLIAVLAAEHDLLDENSTTLADESLRRAQRAKDV